ncbi:hypothetical protein BSKO_00814 [Bryopsis sp. KO-2023]|nr:hypothetical protein BSKO_00814 [Bryopsis sp. KO-2023]
MSNPAEASTGRRPFENTNNPDGGRRRFVLDENFKRSDLPPYLSENEAIASTCDMFLEVEGEEFPVNSSVILIHSKVLGAKIVEAQKELGESASGPLVACLPRETRKDVLLLLDFMYGRRIKVDTLEEAGVLAHFSHKYKIAFPIPLCEQKLCQELPNMHVAGIHHDSRADATIAKTPPESKPEYSLGKWLRYAEHLGMKQFQHMCEFAILTIFLSDTMRDGGAMEAVMSDLVDKHRVKARTLARVGCGMGSWVRSLTRTWWCRSCGGEEGIAHDVKCLGCGRSCEQDIEQFGPLPGGNVTDMIREDKSDVLDLFAKMDRDAGGGGSNGGEGSST